MKEYVKFEEIQFEFYVLVVIKKSKMHWMRILQ